MLLWWGCTSVSLLGNSFLSCMMRSSGLLILRGSGVFLENRDYCCFSIKIRNIHSSCATAWVNLPGMNYTLSGSFTNSIHMLVSPRGCIGSNPGPVCWILIISPGTSCYGGDPGKFAVFNRLVWWGGGGSGIYNHHVLCGFITLVGWNSN